MSFSVGRARFGLYAWGSVQKRYIAVALWVSGASRQAHFHLLEQDRAGIEESLGAALEWHQLSKSAEVACCGRDTDLKLRGQWPEQHAWLAEKLEVFYQVFAPRIKELDAADYVPEDESNAGGTMVGGPMEAA